MYFNYKQPGVAQSSQYDKYLPSFIIKFVYFRGKKEERRSKGGEEGMLRETKSINQKRENENITWGVCSLVVFIVCP